MKTNLFLLFAIIFYFNVTAQNNATPQIGWVEHIITTSAEGPFSIEVADLNGDGDLDVYSCDWNGGSITWYENLGGNDFGDPLTNQQILSSENLDGAFEIRLIDLDGDSDMDIVSCAVLDNTVAWIENLDGGNFGDPVTNQQLITDPSNTDGAWGVYVADLNGDGNLDVISGSWRDDKIAWYENLGDGNFGDPVTNQLLITDPSNTLDAHAVHATDIDGDGDMDVVSTSEGENIIAWYENTDGLGNFGDPLTNQQIIATTGDFPDDVYAEDLDGDDDMDVLSATWIENEIAWYENTNGLGNFGPKQIISTNTPAATDVTAADIDNDGDMDVLSTSWDNDMAAWYENLDGEGNFGPQQIITINADRAIEIKTIHMNDDGDLDVIVASRLDGTIAWYEQVELSVNENALVDFSVYPSPTSGLLNVKSETSIVQIEIYNLLGQLVATNLNQSTIDISGISQGIYFIKIKDENENIGFQKIVKE